MTDVVKQKQKNSESLRMKERKIEKKQNHPRDLKEQKNYLIFVYIRALKKKN